MGTRRLNRVVKKFNQPPSFLAFKGKKVFLVFGLSIMLILSGISLWFLAYLYERFPSLREGPQVSIQSTVTYGNLANSFDTTPEGLEVAVWENGIFRNYVYVDENAEVSYMVNLSRTYQLQVAQGSTITAFDVNLTSGASNDFLLDGWNVELWVYLDGVPSDDFDLYKFIDGAWEWHAIIRTDGTGNYYLSVLVQPIGTYGVLSERTSEFFNFSVTQADEIDFYVELDIVDILQKPKKRKKKKAKNEMGKKNSRNTNEGVIPLIFFFIFLLKMSESNE